MHSYFSSEMDFWSISPNFFPPSIVLSKMLKWAGKNCLRWILKEAQYWKGVNWVSNSADSMMSSCNFSYQNATLVTTSVQHGGLKNSKTPSGCFTLAAHHMKILQVLENQYMPKLNIVWLGLIHLWMLNWSLTPWIGVIVR